MDLLEALEKLDEPLRFGDPYQVDALKFVVAVNKVLDAWEACSHDKERRCEDCAGRGERESVCGECGDKHSRKCRTCDATGSVPADICRVCVPSTDEDVLEGARKVKDHGWEMFKRKRGIN
jgi:hypothetical protein